MLVYLSGSQVRVDPTDAIGQGGEAYVFKHPGGLAMKIFKQPDDPEFENDHQKQEAARLRLSEHQNKLPAFPKGLPDRVITPLELAYSNKQNTNVIGYTMQFLKGSEPLLKYKQRSFRQQGVETNDVVSIFRELYKTVDEIHGANVVIGDFNDLNVLVIGKTPWIIDSDSFQFGKFFCRMFTDRFVDPRLCDPKASSLMLVKPHTADSDWYAFTVMLFESMLFVDPYGGVFKPKDPTKLITHGSRPLKRVTVFHPEVRYPKPAMPYGYLSDELLQYFHDVFEKDHRGKFPLQLLQNIRWTKCTSCGTEHARPACPICKVAAPAAVKEVMVVRGKVMSSLFFKTPGVILCAAYQDKLRFLYHHNGKYLRDVEGDVVYAGSLDPQVRYRVQRDKTHMGKGNELVSFKGSQVYRQSIDTYGTLPMFDSNGERLYWLDGGRLMREGVLGPDYPESIGQVLRNQTLLWTGSTFGFGFYRAAGLAVAFTYNANGSGINDNVALPKISGQLIDSTAVFGKDICWFFMATQEAGKTRHQCFVIKSDGTVVATASAEAGDGSWLGENIRGKAAAQNFVFSATDEGIVRLEPLNGQIIQTREYADTEPFVDSDSQLFVAKEGIYIVDQQEIRLLQIR